MKNTNDIKEQYNELKEEVQAYKQSLYKDYPQVAKFENRKRTCIKILLLLLFIYFILRIYTLQTVMGSNIFLLAISTLIKVDWIFLLAAMNPRWQLSLLLYVMALNNFFLSLSNAGITNILMLLYIIATFVIAAWLTLLPQNRKYAEQSETLNLKIKDFTASLSNAKK